MYGSTPESAPSYYQPRLPQTPTGRAPADGFAITSLVLGILWVSWVGSVIAVVFGHVHMAKAKAMGLKPSGLAVAGLILGYTGVATLALVLLIAIASAAGSGS